MADIFLSYAREDREKAERLAKALEGQGWSVFWDRETPVGVSWRKHIEKELGQSKCVVVAWSSSSVQSEWVVEEAEDGKSREVLIPVSLEVDVRPPFGFRTLQALDLAAWDGSVSHGRFKTLINGLTRFLGDPPTTPAPPTKKASAQKAGTTTRAAPATKPPVRRTRTYPGNATLTREMQERILSTFKQTLTAAAAGNRQEATLGCDFILRLDSLFGPARELLERMKDGEGPVPTGDLAAVIGLTP